MHASTETLLSLRDNEPVDVDVRRHVAACPHCHAALQELTTVQLALRKLPQVQPTTPWAMIAGRLDEPRRKPQHWLAIAAALGLLAIVVWQGIERGGITVSPELVAMPDTTVAPQAIAQSQDTTDIEGLDRLVERSRRLERLLQALDDSAPQVMSVSTAGTIAGLQDGIAIIDFGLSNAEQLSTPESRQLWQQRVSLMNTLVQVRGAQLQQVYY